ncbi:MAG: hypothetical protein K0Q73_8895 [Paenibacillus sp.]|nr:hypothetical protein [Paenibacillus sp.]
MRVLISTIFAYPPRGGVGVHIEELRKGLEQNGHQVDILARDQEQYYITRSNTRIRVSSRRSKTKFPSLFPGSVIGQMIGKKLQALQDEAVKFFSAVQTLDLTKYDVIHAQDIVASSVLGFSKPSHVPLILTIHGCVTAAYYYYGFISPGSLQWNLVSLFETSAIEQSDRTILPSVWLKEVYKKVNIPTGNMTVIHNGIDIPHFQSQMNKGSGLKSPSNKKVIISTGRLEDIKGLDTLLDALAKLKRDRNDWVYWMVGSGAMEKKLKKQTDKLGLEHYVKFLGHRDDVPSLLKQADLFVLPSIHENYPYSLVEAQVAGKVIIASGVGGITEMVQHNFNGLLVPAGDSNKLYQQIKKTLNDSGLQNRLGEQAKIWGKKHLSLPVMMKQILSVYNQSSQKVK